MIFPSLEDDQKQEVLKGKCKHCGCICIQWTFRVSSNPESMLLWTYWVSRHTEKTPFLLKVMSQTWEITKNFLMVHVYTKINVVSIKAKGIQRKKAWNDGREHRVNPDVVLCVGQTIKERTFLVRWHATRCKPRNLLFNLHENFKRNPWVTSYNNILARKLEVQHLIQVLLKCYILRIILFQGKGEGLGIFTNQLS